MDCNNIPARLIRNVGLLAVLALLTACDIGSRELRIYVPSYQQLDPESIQNIFVEQSRIHVVEAVAASGMSPLDAIGTGK